jgi:hypothetical protein
MNAIYTDAELADMFGIDLNKLHTLRKRHRWEYVKFGRYEYRFTAAQVQQIIDSQTVTPHQGAPVATGLSPRSASRKAAS